ncbi:hypothetical protein MtrunA17_Chr3g0094091 [Medicago truncatula]|uniref:Uncharacterized protein n=1 Tax=Medicago truncatula TaxID=3880 RepID=A0A396ILX2_MEDTR|nr:hypothetical protein MtrunA17_Chr3g0094091 [Medicago truncatula]
MIRRHSRTNINPHFFHFTYTFQNRWIHGHKFLISRLFLVFGGW